MSNSVSSENVKEPAAKRKNHPALVLPSLLAPDRPCLMHRELPSVRGRDQWRHQHPRNSQRRLSKLIPAIFNFIEHIYP